MCECLTYADGDMYLCESCGVEQGPMKNAINAFCEIVTEKCWNVARGREGCWTMSDVSKWCPRCTIKGVLEEFDVIYNGPGQGEPS